MKTVLKEALSSTDQVLTLSSGTLKPRSSVRLEDEIVQVTEVITPTQCRIIRGMDGTMAASHPVGCIVEIHYSQTEQRHQRLGRTAEQVQSEYRSLDYGERWVKQEFQRYQQELAALRDRVALLESKLENEGVDAMKSELLKVLQAR